MTDLKATMAVNNTIQCQIYAVKQKIDGLGDVPTQGWFVPFSAHPNEKWLEDRIQWLEINESCDAWERGICISKYEELKRGLVNVVLSPASSSSSSSEGSNSSCEPPKYMRVVSQDGKPRNYQKEYNDAPKWQDKMKICKDVMKIDEEYNRIDKVFLERCHNIVSMDKLRHKYDDLSTKRNKQISICCQFLDLDPFGTIYPDRDFWHQTRKVAFCMRICQNSDKLKQFGGSLSEYICDDCGSGVVAGAVDVASTKALMKPNFPPSIDSITKSTTPSIIPESTPTGMNVLVGAYAPPPTGFASYNYASRDDEWTMAQTLMRLSVPNGTDAGNQETTSKNLPKRNASPKPSDSSDSQPVKRKRVDTRTKRIRKTLPDKKVYVTPTDNDVFMGRGGISNNHPGNKEYRRVILENQQIYKTLSTSEKSELSLSVLAHIHNDCGGRFLEKDKIGWYIVTDHTARLKVSQALREDHTQEALAEKKAKMIEKAKKIEPPRDSAEAPSLNDGNVEDNCTIETDDGDDIII